MEERCALDTQGVVQAGRTPGKAGEGSLIISIEGSGYSVMNSPAWSSGARIRTSTTPTHRYPDYRKTLNITRVVMIITEACLTPARIEASPIAPAMRPEKNAWIRQAW